MNRRIYNPPLAKAGEPTPADAQATATVRIPNVTATGNQLSSLIRNLNELQTDDAEINTRLELARARLEELKDLIQTDPLSAATKDKDGDRKHIDTEGAKDEGEVSNFVPAMHTIPTIVFGSGSAVFGWAEVTYGKVEKPENYAVTDDDLYHVFVRVFWRIAEYDLQWYREIPDPPYARLSQDTLEFPVPTSSYLYLSSFTRAGNPSWEYWTMQDPGPLIGTSIDFYTEEFDPDSGTRPGADKNVNIAMMIRGHHSVERKNIGESEDTAVYSIMKMFPSDVGGSSFPINVTVGPDPLRPGSQWANANVFPHCSDLVIFCTKQDLIEWNELAERHPNELYKIPLID